MRVDFDVCEIFIVIWRCGYVRMIEVSRFDYRYGGEADNECVF